MRLCTEMRSALYVQITIYVLMTTQIKIRLLSLL